MGQDCALALQRGQTALLLLFLPSDRRRLHEPRLGTRGPSCGRTLGPIPRVGLSSTGASEDRQGDPAVAFMGSVGLVLRFWARRALPAANIADSRSLAYTDGLFLNSTASHIPISTAAWCAYLETPVTRYVYLRGSELLNSCMKGETDKLVV